MLRIDTPPPGYLTPSPPAVTNNDSKAADDAKAANDPKAADDVKAADPAAPAAPAAPTTPTAAAEDTSTGSGLDYIDDLPPLIAAMQTNYIGVYVNAMQKYTDFMGEVAKLKSMISSAASASSDSTKTKFDAKTIDDQIALIMREFSGPDSALFTSQQTGEAGKAECQKWAEEFGLTLDQVLVRDDSGKYRIQVDLQPLRNIQTSIDFSGEIKDNLFAGMIAGLDMQVQAMNTTVQKLTEKFSNANGVMNDMMKMLSDILAELQRILAQMMS